NENGQPLVGAFLSVRGVGSTAVGRSTTSDVEGNFRVSGLDPGIYTVFANAPAYTSDPGPPTFYRLGDTVRLEMVRGGVITGTVTNSLGEPVIGVRVRALRIRDAKGQAQKLPGFAVNERSTDDRGIYRIYGLTSGTYLVSAGGGGGFTSGFNPYDSDVPTYSPSSTRDTAAEVSVRAGEESGADIRYRGEPGYTVSGTVNVAGTNGATISLTPVGSGAAVASAFQVPGNRGFAFNGLGDGEYKLVAQELNSVQSAGVMPLMAMSDVKRVTVKGANVTGIELIPKPLASIAGRITLERSKAPECQGKRPPLFAETLVQVQRHENDSEDDDPIYMRMFANSGTVDEKGAFMLRNLRPGRFRFEPRFYARYWYLQSITINTAAPKPQKNDAAANWTTVKSGDQLTALTITLAEGAASIRGRLALAEGAVPPAGMVVYLIPAEPDKADDVLRFFVTDIASDGSFTLNNLAPGKYLVFTQTNVDPQIGTLTKLRQPEAASARTKLRRSSEAQKGEAQKGEAQKGETQKTEIELKPCQNLADYQLK
ncbi:MAG TPA: carboxypeptidase-like regulatory domain-containing protein, partial [Pyrinomonadaceae bacterium]|nr:carboxypeptidase-like regulatory domain-containing protein [Pyrinomonadaceae bacterium]